MCNLEDFRKFATLRGHERSILTLRVHMGRLYSSAGCTVKIWNLTTYECETSLHWGPARCGEILSLATCGNWLYAGFRDGVVRSVLNCAHDDSQPTSASPCDPVSDFQSPVVTLPCLRVYLTTARQSVQFVPGPGLRGRKESRSHGAHGFQRRT